MTEDNQNFFHMHRLDTNGSLKDILWIDARSRDAWEEFEDVVCFDATYLTNEYELPFANFIGVNHHGQIILLGCTLVSHEDTETYQWVFRTWLACMRKNPIGILFDQAAAMRKALSIEMPEARRRWCLWHITYKFVKKLGAKNNFSDIKKALLNAVYNSLTKAEFEESWTATIGKFNLQEDTWLSGLYEEREMWVPAYMKHLFWAGMKTTQRVESIYSFFDGYLDKHTRLYQFGPAYMKAMESRANDEQQADANSNMYLRTLVTGFAVEKTFQLLYTDAKFKEVQKQCTKCLYDNGVSRRAISEYVVEHTLEDRIWMHCDETKKEKLTSKTRCYQVMVDRKTLYALCVCKMFECEDSGVCSTTDAPKVKDPVDPKKAANRPLETRFLSCVEKPKKKVAKKKEVVTNKVADGCPKPTKKVAKGANKVRPKEKNVGPSKFGQDKDTDGMEAVGGHKSIGGITCNEGSIGYFTRMLQGGNSEQPNIDSGDQCHDMLRLRLG
ncbi:protein FAR1-RELATED SEQUENCE 6-like [Beta vulgaris subsp. vulgaris]|uniref:protein FAR1-RELATED SEQUENCE 6-like n=1 Tax=Beta vulgaris subsp. vulgaris TaxID=3555 RepID=UPI002549AF11|nr:protein FAR1-RELATED SEQUENCE 6-like [Beta vulgaris subsp. vulgaris]